MDLHNEQLKVHVKAELLNIIIDLKEDDNYTKNDAANELIDLIMKLDL